MITPVFTEKSLKLAKGGKYTFLVGIKDSKPGLKSLIGKMFNVHVSNVRTITSPAEVKRNQRGRKITIKPSKKVIVTLKEGDKIEIFEESKK